MNGSVPVLSMVFMAVSCVIGFAIPVAALLWIRKKKRADILPFFIGCAVFILFALVLEALVHRLILGSRVGATIQNSVWLYALYGGLMAGLFEETGRFLAFKFMPKRYRSRDVNALMYGAGHGGIEAFVILGITSINNIIYSVLINTGRAEVLTAPLAGDMRKQVEAAIHALITTPSWYFLIGGVERILAVVLQISLSVLVWFAAKKKNRIYYYPLAIVLHLIVDAGAVILSGWNASPLVVEVVVAAFTVLSVLIAGRVWQENTDGEPQGRFSGSFSGRP